MHKTFRFDEIKINITLFYVYRTITNVAREASSSVIINCITCIIKIILRSIYIYFHFEEHEKYMSNDAAMTQSAEYVTKFVFI